MPNRTNRKIADADRDPDRADVDALHRRSVLVRGLMGAMDNPSPNAKPHSSWAWRQMHAHDNAVENLVIFAILVLVANALHISTNVTAAACATYFWARLAHYIIYTLGVPVLRTLTFVAAFAAQVVLVLAIFRAV